MFTFQHELWHGERREEVRQIILQPATRETREEKTLIWIKWGWVCKFNCDQGKLRLEPKAGEKSVCSSLTAQGRDCKAARTGIAPSQFLLSSHAAPCSTLCQQLHLSSPHRNIQLISGEIRKKAFPEVLWVLLQKSTPNEAVGCLKQTLGLAENTT